MLERWAPSICNRAGWVAPQTPRSIGDAAASRTCGSARDGFERDGGKAGCRPSVAGTRTARFECRPCAGIDDADGTVTTKVAGGRFCRSHRRRQADALRVTVSDGGKTLQRRGQMYATLGRQQRVDLVDDHRFHCG